jgi:hypothetical protein
MEVIEKCGLGVKADNQLLSLKIGFVRRSIEGVPLLECGILLLMKSYLKSKYCKVTINEMKKKV